MRRIRLSLLLCFPQLAFAASTGVLGPVIMVLGVQLIVILAVFARVLLMRNLKKSLILLSVVIATVVLLDVVIPYAFKAAFVDGKIYLWLMALLPTMVWLLAEKELLERKYEDKTI